MNKVFAKFPKLWWVALCLLCLASCSANPIPDLASLRHQLQKPDPAAIKTIIGNPQDQIDILAVQAGGLWFLAQKQAAAQDWLSASALYRAQLEKGGPVWKGLAWRGWLNSQRSALAWKEIIEQGPGLFGQLEAALNQSTDDQAAVGRELRDSREAWQQAEIEARIQLGQLDQANAAVARALASWPENTVPDWLSLGQAKLGWLQVGASGKGADEAFLRTQYRSLCAVDAQAAHGELLLIVKALAPRINPKKNPKLELILKLLQAKATLAQGQAANALGQMRGLLLPRGKASKSELQAIKRKQALLLEILDSEPGLVFWRDFYNAVRLAGQLSDGVSLIDDLRGQIAAKLRRPEPVVAYLYELQGRLLRAKSDHAGAAVAFGKSLDLALALEGRGKFDSVDRRRVQWYLLRSYTDQAGDQDAPRNFDFRAFGRSAKLTDDPAYFDDVLERAVLICGGRQRWADLEWLYKNCAPNMTADLQARCAIVLARVSQLKLKAGDASEKDNFERLSGEAIKTPSSLYYQILARWLRAEAINIGDLLGGQTALGATENTAAGDWAAQVAQAHVALELYDAGVDFVWDLRKEISPARFMALGFAYVDAKRYRQGLRILESARVRLGHPADQSSLGYFYPRPYLELIHRAVDNTSLPEWLMLAMVRTESNFDIAANSGAGARGLAQLMPATAKLVAAKLGLEDADLDDPAINLRLGSSYLLDQYKGFGKWPQALAAYNAGLGRTRSWIKSGLPADPILFTELIPVEESRNYVHRIIESGLLYNHLYYGVDNQAVLSLIFQNP